MHWRRWPPPRYNLGGASLFDGSGEGGMLPRGTFRGNAVLPNSLVRGCIQLRLLRPSGCVTALVLGCHAVAAPLAYLPGGDEVAIVDLATNAVVSRVAVGRGAFGVAVDATSNRIYVTSVANSTVAVIDGATNRVTATVGVGTLPFGIAVSASAGRAYVANASDGTVSVIDTSTHRVVATVPVGAKPYGVAVNPAGTRVYVANTDSDTVTVLDTATNAVVATVPTAGGPLGLVVSPAGTRIYVTDRDAAAISVIDASTHTVVASVSLGPISAFPPVWPLGIAIDPAGTRLYVTQPNINSVSVIDTARNQLLATVPVRPFPSYVFGVAVDPTGRYAYVADQYSDAVVVLDSSTNTVVATFAVGLVPNAFGQFIVPGPVAPGGPVAGVEYYNRTLDHYFLTHVAAEIATLDAGTQIKGWVRTGLSFKVWPAAMVGSSPVCRYYIPPGKGDSHFYGRGSAECEATRAANPTFINEDPPFFHVVLPVAGTCPAGTRNLHRAFSNRADANHRYTIEPTIRDQMVAQGWIAEGDGPNLVAMCVPN